MAQEFDWKRAQERELQWWKEWQSKETPEFGKGGLSRYHEYFRVFGPFFSKRSILDVGGGAFPLVNWLEDCPRRVALDPLNGEYAANGFARQPGVECLIGLAESLPFPDGSFDQVLLFNMLDHFDDWKRAVDEAWRVAGGSVLIHVHIDGPYASDGMHRILREPELVEYFEGRYGGERLEFIHPRDVRLMPRRCLSAAKRALTGKGAGFRLPVEKCWAGILWKGEAAGSGCS